MGSAKQTRRWLLGSLAAVALGVAGAASFVPTANAAAEEGASLKGKAAPDIALKTLAGEDVKLSDQQGKVVLVDFWATWCPPCVKGLPHINEIAGKKEWKEKGLVVWAVNLRETEDKVKTFVTDKKLDNLTVPMDEKGATAAAYAVKGIPTTVVIGRDGKVAEVIVGLGPAAALDAAIEKALNAKAPKASKTK